MSSDFVELFFSPKVDLFWMWPLRELNDISVTNLVLLQILGSNDLIFQERRSGVYSAFLKGMQNNSGVQINLVYRLDINKAVSILCCSHLTFCVDLLHNLPRKQITFFPVFFKDLGKQKDPPVHSLYCLTSEATHFKSEPIPSLQDL